MEMQGGRGPEGHATDWSGDDSDDVRTLVRENRRMGRSMKTAAARFSLPNRELRPEPLHYTVCGLDDIY